jgi:group I intron endonuclease
MHVYLIQNTVNGKCYVGQHAGEDLEKYWRHNVKAALAGRGNKLFLYRAIRKYGPENFTIRTIHVPVDAIDMTNAEIAYIKFFGTQNDELGYNITAGGPGRLGTTYPHTQAFKDAMSARLKGKPRPKEWGDNIRKAQLGKKLSSEHVAALKAGQKGCKKPPRTEEHKRRLIESRKRNKELKLNAQLEA